MTDTWRMTPWLRKERGPGLTQSVLQNPAAPEEVLPRARGHHGAQRPSRPHGLSLQSGSNEPGEEPQKRRSLWVQRPPGHSSSQVHSQGRALARKPGFCNVFLNKVRTNPATHRLSPATTTLAQKSQQGRQLQVWPALLSSLLSFYFIIFN